MWVHNEGPAIHCICIILKYSDNWTKKEHLHGKTVISYIISRASPRKEWDLQEPRESSPKSPFDFCLELEEFVGRGALGGVEVGENWGLFCFDLERRRQKLQKIVTFIAVQSMLSQWGQY